MSLSYPDAVNQHIGFPGGVMDKVRQFFNAIYTGSGSPEGVLTAPIGSLYLDTTNGAYYGKASGSGNTGWVLPGNSAYVPSVDTTETGFHRNTDSATYGAWYTIGNKPNSAGFAGTGTPAEAYGPFVLYHDYGLSPSKATVLPGTITKTTQGFFGIVNYWNKTTDDAMEAGSIGVFAKDNTSKASGAAFTQSLGMTCWEMIAQVESPNIHDGGDLHPIVAGSARTMVPVGATAATVAGFKVTHNPSVTPGTTTKYIGFWQQVASGAATAYGVYVVDGIVSETSVALGASGNTGSVSAKLNGNPDANVSMMLVQGPTSNPGLSQMTLVAGSTQTKPILSLRDSGGTNRVQWSSAGFQTMNGVGIQFQASGVTCARIDSTGYVQPGASASAGQSATAAGSKIYSGSGAPALIGVVGDLYVRTDGGVGTTLYRCTVAGAAGVATWTAIL